MHCPIKQISQSEPYFCIVFLYCFNSEDLEEIVSLSSISNTCCTLFCLIQRSSAETALLQGMDKIGIGPKTSQASWELGEAQCMNAGRPGDGWQSGVKVQVAGE